MTYLGRREWTKRKKTAVDFYFSRFACFSVMTWKYVVSHRKGLVLLQTSLVIGDSCEQENQAANQAPGQNN